MPFRVRYRAEVDWMPAGIGPMSGTGTPVIGEAPTGGGGQTLAFFQTTPLGSPTFTASDITTLTNAIAADLVTQFTAQLARVQAFSTGGG